MLDPEYAQAILNQHARSPRHYGPLPIPPAAHVTQTNPICGDEVTVFLEPRAAGTLIQFTAQACGICTASASLMCARLRGHTLEQARFAVVSFLAFLSGDLTETGELGDLQALAGVRAFPQRIGCATLPWKALMLALEEGVGAEEGVGVTG
ncbi:MAG TPA: iron-sulfur cluster assembly scaffold protein [Chthoniobacterales bacterium]